MSIFNGAFVQPRRSGSGVPGPPLQRIVTVRPSFGGVVARADATSKVGPGITFWANAVEQTRMLKRAQSTPDIAGSLEPYPTFFQSRRTEI
jgi:hypothetical protein